MTQKTMAQQIAEAQNIITALSKQIEAPVERKLKKFLCTYDDGTEQWFVPEEVQPIFTTKEILSQVRDRHLPKEIAEDTLPMKQHLKPGLECIINGVRYRSVMHASRITGVCRHSIKDKLDKRVAGYQYV
jgi:hypothetical protein